MTTNETCPYCGAEKKYENSAREATPEKAWLAVLRAADMAARGGRGSSSKVARFEVPDMEFKCGSTYFCDGLFVRHYACYESQIAAQAAEIERLKKDAREERAQLVEELNYSSNKLWDLAQAIRERATEEFTSCNPHPAAPHGFNRTASHNEGRYVCDCEYWKEDQE